MKNKFLRIITIMFLVIFAYGMSVYAKETISSANITVKSLKDEYNAKETAEFVIHLDNLIATKGIITFGASIEYNHDILELIEIEGAKGWSDNDNSSNVIGIYRASNSENAEDIATIRFKVLNPTETTSLSIKLNNIDISNGGGYKINSISSNAITVNASENVNPPDQDDNQGDDNPVTPPTQDEGNGNNGNQGGNTNPPSEGDGPDQDDSQNGGNHNGNHNDNSSGSDGNDNPVNPPIHDGDDGNSGNQGEDANPPAGGNGTSQGNGQNSGNQNENQNQNGNSDKDSDKLNGNTNGKPSTNVKDKNIIDNKKDIPNTIIPQLGSNYPLGIFILATMMVAVVLLVKVKLLDRKIKKSEIKISDNDEKK